MTLWLTVALVLLALYFLIVRPLLVGRGLPKLTVEEARKMARERRASFLDVRSLGEYRRGAINGALHIPMADVGSRLTEIPADRPLVVYCATGLRSAMVVRMLMRQGRKDVYNLTGGIVAWQRVGKG